VKTLGLSAALLVASYAAAGEASSLRPQPPTAGQIAAYEALRREASAYDQGASDYKDTVASIVTLHYQEKKREILGDLDREIGAEKVQLERARETAIRRLEEFVSSHSGAAAQPEATPDAMYRLAALYEERARAGDRTDADVAAALAPAIHLYKRVIREFPRYRELAGVYYFLGHALDDARRTDEAQQVWRSLVCHDRYPYPVAADPRDPERDVVAALPQDHDAAYWKVWRARYDRPGALTKARKSETTFDNPYPSGCRAIEQPGVQPGQEPRYLAEVWWRMGEWEFDQNDAGGGVLEGEPSAVWDYDRAASAYRHALEFRRPPIHGIALYKYAWTLFKQQRYEAAVREFVRLLRYTDEQERLSGERGADFRQEAYTYIAGSLDHVDFAGPEPDEPFVARPDVLDTARTPGEAETKLRVAIDRVQDPRIVPQDEPWTIEVYRALAIELRSIGQYRNALALYQLILDRWPLDPSAPETQNAIADVDELLARQTKVGDERRGYEQQVLVARTALSYYVGDTAWVDANRDNPPALRRAEELARTGLEGAAATHTRDARAALEQAGRTADPRERTRLAEYALDEYRLAATGWRGLVDQARPDTPGTYRRRYFLADALHKQVRLVTALHASAPATHPPPRSQEIAAATEAAVAVRDSDEDDRFVDNAGLFVVDVADVGRDLAGLGGHEGPRLDGPPEDRRVVAETIPEALRSSIEARDEYVRRVPPERDPQERAGEYALYAAEQLYRYGHFDEARARFEPIYEAHCARDPLGYEAWKRLIEMSNLQKDAARSRALAEAEKARSCAFTEAQKAEEQRGMLTDGVLQAEAFDRARALHEQGLWKQACDANEGVVRAFPAHDAAPGATLLAAYACAQDGRPRKAIDLYELFVGRYGGREDVEALEPASRAQRLEDLGRAYDAVSMAHYRLFEFANAADSFARTAADDRAGIARRVTAARNAMTLYSSLGERERASAMHGVLLDPALHLGPAEHAEVDFLDASFDYARWSASNGDDGARRRAVDALARFHEEARKRPEGARLALEAAHRVVDMMRAGHDPRLRSWLKATVADWQSLASYPAWSKLATEAPYADYGAEAEFALVDEEIREGFDFATGHHRYRGTVAQVRAQVDRDLESVSRKWKPLLDHVARTFGSFQWAAAATAREGSLYDSIRTGLDLVVPEYFTREQTTLFARLETLATQFEAAGRTSDAEAIRERVAEMQQQVRDAWHTAKERTLEDCTRPMVGKYATAAVAARATDVIEPAIQDAIARLAHYTDYLGDAAMKRYVESTADPTNPTHTLVYTDGQFLRWRPGVGATGPGKSP
jgi:tetratricopeptide (TPR) repeat protein